MYVHTISAEIPATQNNSEYECMQYSRMSDESESAIDDAPRGVEM